MLSSYSTLNMVKRNERWTVEASFGKKLNINHYKVEQENANEPFQARSSKPGGWTPYNGLREVVPFLGFRYTERERKSVISVGKKLLNCRANRYILWL